MAVAKKKSNNAGGAKLDDNLKRLVNKVMGVNFKAPDRKAGRELLTLVEHAERDDDKRFFKALARQGSRDIILWAAEEGRATFVKRLIEAGVNPDHRSLGISPMYCAATKGKTEVIEVLVNAGESANAIAMLKKPILLCAAEKG